MKRKKESEMMEARSPTGVGMSEIELQAAPTISSGCVLGFTP